MAATIVGCGLYRAKWRCITISNNIPAFKNKFGNCNKHLCIEKTLHSGPPRMVGAVVGIDWQLKQSA